MKARPYPNRAPEANPSRGDFSEGLRADGPRVCERPPQAPLRRGCSRLGEHVDAAPLPRPRAGAAAKARAEHPDDEYGQGAISCPSRWPSVEAAPLHLVGRVGDAVAIYAP
jgi:hypothetical protein